MPQSKPMDWVLLSIMIHLSILITMIKTHYTMMPMKKKIITMVNKHIKIKW